MLNGYAYMKRVRDLEKGQVFMAHDAEGFKPRKRRLTFTNNSTIRVTSSLCGRPSFVRPHFFDFCTRAQRNTMAREEARQLHEAAPTFRSSIRRSPCRPRWSRRRRVGDAR